MSATATLFLIPSHLGGDSLKAVLPDDLASIVKDLKFIVGEEEKSLRRFIKKLVPDVVLSELSISLLNEHSTPEDLEKCVALLKSGNSVGLVSEAGCPVIADPGAPLVRAAHKLGVKVVPLVGPSSIILALMSSGLSGQRFRFLGYLPKEKDKRSHALKELENTARRQSETQVFIETPYRNNAMLESILQSCSDNLILSVACALTTTNEKIISQPISEWRKLKEELPKEPVVFCLGF